MNPHTDGANERASEEDVNNMRAVISTMSEDLFEKHNKLREIVLRFEALIRKRWTIRYPTSRREQLLLKAWPKISRHQRPDLDTRKSLYNEPFAALLPIINLEDLKHGSHLLLFLNERAHRDPHEYFETDLEMASVCPLVASKFHTYVHPWGMLFEGRNSPSTYGEFVEAEDKENGFDEVHHFKNKDYAVRTDHGFKLMSVQLHIYRFLICFCEAILHDQDITDLSKTPREAPLPPPTIEPAASVAEVRTMSLYRRPSHIDLQNLWRLTNAKRHEAADHIILLRENPSYYEYFFKEWKDHIIPERNKHVPVDVQALAKVISRAYGDLEIWTNLADLAKSALDERNKLSSTISSSDPEYYMFRFSLAMLLFRARRVHRYISGPELVRRFQCSHDMQVSYAKIAAGENVIDDTIENLKPSDHAKINIGRLLFFVVSQTKQRASDAIHRVESYLDESDDWKYISPLVERSLDDVSMVSFVMDQIGSFHPGAWWIESVLATKKTQDDLQKQFFGFDARVKNFYALKFPEESHADLYQLCTPAPGKFDYPDLPAGKFKPTANVLQKRINSEENLDKLWAAIDVELDDKFDSPLLKSLLTTRDIYRTSPSRARTPERAEPADHYDLSSISESLPDLPIHSRLGQHENAKTDPQPAKIKVKTRGIAERAEEVLEDDEEEAPEPQQPKVYPVDKRVLQVFETLFPSAHRQGDLLWTDFLYAMTALGFESYKTTGSIWVFTPTLPEFQRPITFHDSHGPRIPYHVARRHGRRLNRVYGLDLSSFTSASSNISATKTSKPTARVSCSFVQLPTLPTPTMFADLSRPKTVLSPWQKRAHKLNESIFIKHGRKYEIQRETDAIQFVRRHTSIPLPSIIESRKSEDDSWYTMQVIPGKSLSDAWTDMSEQARLKTRTELCGYIKELRAIQPPEPVYIGSCTSSSAYDHRLNNSLPCGPFSSESAFNDFLVSPVQRCPRQELVAFYCNQLKDTHQIVFTHADLCGDHIIVDPVTGKINGIIDWEMAGWWPEYWEYTKALYGSRCQQWWKLLVSEAVGEYSHELKIDIDLQQF